MKKLLKIYSSRLFKLCVVAFFSVTGVLLCLLTIYNLTVFKPNLLSIQRKIENTEFDYRQMSTISFKTIKLSQGIDQVDKYIANRLLVEMVKEKGKLNNWAIEYALWNYLIKAYLKEEERIILWCELAPYELGAGLNNASKYHYNKSIIEISPKEIIRLVVIAKSPRKYEKQPLEIDEKADNIFKLIERDL